ncbi:uncharacterized protein LOC121737153 [Aricia agestis]|uniref:uncharacterized protein LOC121737153 n=1 Tax=Aricia agestis TaxID=91739 RepID=UPI001C201F09|nr:uncharacterized protein LOC121737153 [Aricia agestis]
MYLYILLACFATATALPTEKTDNITSSTTTTTTESPSNSTKELLKASETGDPTQVEIVKQIRRLNEDGSYTIGYEATDGTFKIESRDVLGNVKGTFGYIDDDGEIKRVTYTSNGESTPVPVSTSTTPNTPMMIVRVNKTVSSTTRRPLPTVVYPTRGSATTRGTVIQSIPRRRPITHPNNLPESDITTEKSNYDDTTQSNFNRYRSRDEASKLRTTTVKDDLVTKQTTVTSTVKPVYEEVTEKEPDMSKPSAFRRELPGRNTNHHMVNLQQSMGDDSTDVYGSHLSHGTLRPLFTTTTTSRPRHVPLRNLIPRQNTQEHYPDNLENQETTIEASTGRVFDTNNIATSSPVPVIHIQPQRVPEDQRVYQQTLYRRPQSSIQFRTQEYLRDNPGAPIPIGNQRPFLQYDYQQNKVLEPQLLRESQPKASNDQYEVRPVTRIIQVPVDERGVPIPGYEPRYVNPYQPQPVYQRYDPTADMNSISAPVSTRDLKRLLQILILRQSRLQALMDQLMPGPYQPYRDMYRQQIRHYDEDDRYDYHYDQQYRQDAYANQDRYEDQYDSQRYVPRRRYSRPFDSVGSSSNHIDEAPEYLPVEVREALLLKMLLLAISPDYTPRPIPPTELTTAAPTRKQVRNVQILGEEGATEKPKRH